MAGPNSPNAAVSRDKDNLLGVWSHKKGESENLVKVNRQYMNLDRGQFSRRFGQRQKPFRPGKEL